MPGSKKKKFNVELAARVLVDAIALGDKTAADRHEVSEKTIQRYRARAKTDTTLSARVRELGKEAEHGWHFARARFLRRTLKKLDELVEQATREDFEQVIAAMKAAGELDLATEALGVGSVDRQQGAGTAAHSGGTSAEADGDGPDLGTPSEDG